MTKPSTRPRPKLRRSIRTRVKRWPNVSSPARRRAPGQLADPPRPDQDEQRRLDREVLENERRSLLETGRELEASRERYVALYDFAPVGYLTLDRFGCVISANLTAARMLGSERNRLIGSPMLPRVASPERRAFLRYLYLLNKGTSEPATSEYWFPQKTGEPVLLQFVSQRSLEHPINAPCLHCAIRDVTRQRRAEEDQRRLAAIVHYSEDAVIGEGLDGVISTWNRGAEKLFGFTEEEVIGRSSAVFIPRERHGEGLMISDKIRRGKAVAHFETLRLRKDGGEIPVSLTVSPVKDADGKAIGVSIIARDISRRREAEAALRKAHDELEQRVRDRTAQLTAANAALQAEIAAHRKAEAALRLSEARLQAILDNSPEMVFLKDTEGRYLLHNRRFHEALELPAQGAIGKTDFAILPSADARIARATDSRVIKTGQAIQFESVIHSHGESRVSMVSKFPVHDNEGSIFAVGCIVTDITERRRLEGEVLRISEHERQRIARDLHDSLGQQIAGTWFLTDILRKNLAAQCSPELPTASKVVELLQSTVTQTRNLALGLSPIPIEPEGLMTALNELARQTSEVFKVDCRFICPRPILLPDNSKAAHLYRIAQEALNNAVKHGRAEKIEIGLSAIGNCLTLRIRDNGVGFENSGKRGTGMGLRTMGYRADLMGADFAILERRAGGTEIVCKLRKDKWNGNQNDWPQSATLNGS